MTETEAIAKITREIKALSSNYSSDDYFDAVDNAERETGFVFPTTDSFQIQWLIERIKRALFFSLLVANAEAFKFKQISLQQKFENLRKLVEDMDKKFEQAQKEYIYEFANVDPVQAFSHQIRNGFAYDSIGRDITFSKRNLVGINPSSTDDSES